MTAKLRQFTAPEQALIRMSAALSIAEIRHGSCANPMTKDLCYCSCFWKIVFRHIHGEAPEGNADPRWDTLFALGFPTMRVLSERAPAGS